jgi:hypothetical protein
MLRAWRMPGMQGFSARNLEADDVRMMSPIEESLSAPSSAMLKAIDATVKSDGVSRLNPSVYFSPIAHPIWHRPTSRR